MKEEIPQINVQRVTSGKCLWPNQASFSQEGMLGKTMLYELGWHGYYGSNPLEPSSQPFSPFKPSQSQVTGQERHTPGLSVSPLHQVSLFHVSLYNSPDVAQVNLSACLWGPCPYIWCLETPPRVLYKLYSEWQTFSFYELQWGHFKCGMLNFFTRTSVPIPMHS